MPESQRIDPVSGRGCFFAKLLDAGPCDGRVVRCHLVDQQQLRKDFKYGVEFDAVSGQWVSIGRQGHKRRLHVGRANLAPFRSLSQLQEDPRSWVWGCGGPMGLEGHHGRFDGRLSPRLVVPRRLVPPATEEFCAELGLGWWLDRRYGEVT